MPPGDDSSGEEESERSGPEPAADPPEPTRHRSPDPAVDSVWLGRRRSPHPLGRPRLSTVLMIAAFVGLLMLYLVLSPGG